MGLLRFCCLVIGVLVAGHSWADSCRLESYGTLPAEMVGNHATTMVKINGADTRFILDTGAYFNVMSKASASALKLDTQPAPAWFQIAGVGGAAAAGLTSVKEFGIVGTTLHHIAFVVGGSDMGQGLLGANVLDAADLEIDLAGGKLTLFNADQCDKAVLAYWVKDGGEYEVADLHPSDQSNDQRAFIDITVNGKKLRALLDTGAAMTVLSRSAAERAGIDLHAPDVKLGSGTYGIGGQLVKDWIVRVDSFSVGTEAIRHSQMVVIDGTFGDDDTDVILGVDFILAHHMFIANSQRKAYFTYNGGRIFTLAEPSGDGGKSDVNASEDKQDAVPKTADDYALLGEAHLSRGESSAAIADLNEAIRMAPGQAGYHVALARALASVKQFDAALAELDKSLNLDPKSVDTLLLRAGLRLEKKDREGAAADVASASSLVTAGSKQAYAVADLDIGLEQPAAALPLLDDWIRLHEDDAMLGSAFNARCWARSLSNQMLDEALNDCHKAIRRDGEKATYLDSLGMVQLRLGHYPESIKAYRQAIAGKQPMAWSRYGLGLAEIRNGQVEAGNADLAAARELDPQIEGLAGKYGLSAAGP